MEDGWIEWAGGDECPVADGVMIDVRLRGGEPRLPTRGRMYRWDHLSANDRCHPFDIVAYKVRSS